MTRLSVIMLTYNRKSFVDGMIADIREQTFPDFEFIIVDNGSTDGTAELVDLHACDDPRIRVRHIPKSSIGRGRNVGVAEARGEYLTFVDDDDRVDTDFLEFLLTLTENDAIDVALCGTDESTDGIHYVPQCVFDERRVIGPEEAVRLLLERTHIRAGMPAKCIRAEIMRKYPCKEDCRHEDIFTTYKYLAEARQVAMWGKPKYHILRHAENVSAFTGAGTAWTPTVLDEYMAAFRERTEFLSARLPKLAAFARYSEWSYMLSMLEKISRLALTGFGKQRRRIHAVLDANRTEFTASPFLKDFERKWLQQYIWADIEDRGRFSDTYS